MSSQENKHKHKWKYGDVRHTPEKRLYFDDQRIDWETQEEKFRVYRYCLQCRIIEDIDLIKS